MPNQKTRNLAKSIASNVLLLTISLVITLLIAEFLVRQIAPQKLYRFPQHMFVGHPTADYQLAPNFDSNADTTEYDTQIITNSLGLREPREFDAHATDVTRVILLGDSFTMGVGVNYEDTFGHQSEQILGASNPDWDLQTVNMGVPGYHTGHAKALLEDIGYPLDPALVVLNLYVGNDITQNISSDRYTVVDGRLRAKPKKQGMIPTAFRDFLQMNSHLYQFVWPIQRRILDPDFAEKQRRSQLRALAIYDVNKTTDSSELWRATEQRLVALHDSLKSRNIPFLVVIVPEKLQISDKQWSATLVNVGLDESTHLRSHPAAQIADLCERLGVAWVDLLPALTSAEIEEPMYFAIDGHWTVAGNEVAARALAGPLAANIATGDVTAPLEAEH